MLQRPVIWIILTILLLIGGVFWYRLSPKTIEVIVAPVEKGTVEKVVANTRAGTLKACRQAHLSPAVGGQLSVLAVKKGDIVKEGQLLLELWNKDLVAEKQLAASEAKSARARAESARIQTENSSREEKRLKPLIQIGAISEETLDKAKSQTLAREFDYKALLAAIETSDNRLHVVTTQLERTRLLAPFSGIIAEIHGELNEYITPSPPGIATLPTIELLDTSCFYVTAPIDEVDAAKVTIGASARITMDAFPGRHFNAQVRRIAPYVLDLEKQARTVEVELELTDLDKEQQLLAGYSADVEIILEGHGNTLRVPTQALLPGNRIFVYQQKNGRIEERTVRTGLSNWDKTEVIEGVRAGEQVVLSIDQPGLKDNAPARVSQEKSSKDAPAK
jgi:HlyD family secretion protein